MGDRVCYILCTFLIKYEIIKKGRVIPSYLMNCTGVLWLEFLKKIPFCHKAGTLVYALSVSVSPAVSQCLPARSLRIPRHSRHEGERIISVFYFQESYP